MVASRDRVYRFSVIFVMFPPLTVYFLANAVVRWRFKGVKKITENHVSACGNRAPHGETTYTCSSFFFGNQDPHGALCFICQKSLF